MKLPIRLQQTLLLTLGCVATVMGLSTFQPTETAEKAGQTIDRASNNTGIQLADAKQAVVDAVGTTREVVDDSVIITRIKKLMIKDAFLKASAIEVTAVSGVVTVTGSVDSTQLVGRAIDLAYRQKGVKSVTNDLTINAAVLPSKQ
ncbi:MAG: BON domain-containing protein [Gammaproteobacteria bacterium]